MNKIADRLGAIDFSNLIDAATAGYIPREEIETELRSHIGEDKAGVCLLVGEPGSGKTRLAAAMIRKGGYLHHFLRRGHAEFGLWRDPYGFLCSIAFQLQAEFGDLLFPRASVVKVTAAAGQVAPDGEIVGAEIETLVPLPWHSSQLDVHVHVGQVAGSAIGVKIKNLLEDYRRIPLMAFRSLALLDPLRRLRAARPGTQVVLWVDGLDEATGWAGSDEASIVDVLLTHEEARQLGNVMVVVSARPCSAVKRLHEGGARVVDLSSARFEEERERVAARLVDRCLSEKDVLQQLDRAKVGQDQLRELLALEGLDNLLYVDQVFQEVRNGRVAQLLEDGLPSSLDQLYARLLGRLQRDASDLRIAALQPVLAILAVAQVPLGVAQIARFSGIDEQTTKRIVAMLRPYLDSEVGKDGDVYSLYHQSFGDALCRSEHSGESWFVDSEAAHARIAKHYLPMAEREWVGLDEYGLTFLTEHLQQGTRSERARLISLMGEPWRRVKRRHHRSNWAFENDLAKAAGCASELELPQAVASIAKLGMMSTRLERATGDLPQHCLETMVRLGSVARALEFVRPSLSVGQKVDRLAEILSGLKDDPELVARVSDRALAELAKEPDHGQLSNLLRAIPARPEEATPELLQRAVEIFNAARPSWTTAGALRELARLLTVHDADQAAKTFEQACEAVRRLGSSRALEAARLVDRWCAFDPQGADRGLRRIELFPEPDAVLAILSVARACEPVGGVDRRTALETIETELIPNAPDPFREGLACAHAAGEWVELGDMGRASTLVSRAQECVKKIGGESDPESNLQARASYAVTVDMHLAPLALRIDRRSGRHQLEHAWSGLREEGYFSWGSPLEALAEAQLASKAELLRVQIRRIEDPARRAEVAACAARVLVKQGEPDAGELLEEALIIGESAETGGLDTSHLRLAAATVLAPEDLSGARELIEEMQDSAAWLTWHLQQLNVLLSEGDPRAIPLLRSVIEAWDGSEHFEVLALPAWVTELSEPGLEVVAAMVPAIESEPHRLALRGAVAAAGCRLGRSDCREELQRVTVELQELLEQGPPSGRVVVRDLLALLAGFWWSVDRGFGRNLWITALLLLRREIDSERHGVFLQDLCRAFTRAAPAGAIECLLGYREPPAPPDVFTFCLPGPGISPELSAGLSGTDLLLSEAMAAELVGSKVDPLPVLGWLVRPELVCLAATALATTDESAPLDERADWCELAAENASRVEADHMRCLLGAGVARACGGIGMFRKAAELATTSLELAVEEGRHIQAIQRVEGYGHGVGRALQALCQVERTEVVPDWLWRARRLGPVFTVALSYVVEPVWRTQPNTITLLDEACREARALFSVGASTGF